MSGANHATGARTLGGMKSTSEVAEEGMRLHAEHRAERRALKEALARRKAQPTVPFKRFIQYRDSQE